MSITPGSRLRCEQCGTETIVISGVPDLTCCDRSLTVTFTPNDGSSAKDDDAS